MLIAIAGVRPEDTGALALLQSTSLEMLRVIVGRPQYQNIRNQADHNPFHPPSPSDSLDLALNFESHEG